MNIHKEEETTTNPNPEQVQLSPEQFEAQMREMENQINREFNLTRLRGLALEVKKKKFDFLTECVSGELGELLGEELVNEMKADIKTLAESVLKIPA